MFKAAVAAAVLSLGVSAQVLAAVPAAADPPPAFDIPVEVLPRIVVPPDVSRNAGPTVTMLLNSLLNYDAQNPDVGKALFRGLADFSCGVVTLFGRAC